jgi:tetratricopeptide (TPR) repeat protein
MKSRWVFWLGFSLFLQCQNALAYDLHDNAILHARRGQLFLERQQPQDAIEEYKAAILLNPTTSMSAALYNDLGIAYRENGQATLAIASFQHACRIQPTYALYFQNLIETYVAAQQTAQAELELQRITQENPDDAEAWFMLGLLYKETGNRKQAKACLARFLKLKPESELAQAARTAL